VPRDRGSGGLNYRRVGYDITALHRIGR